jgi:hypothetical protein
VVEARNVHGNDLDHRASFAGSEKVHSLQKQLQYVRRVCLVVPHDEIHRRRIAGDGAAGDRRREEVLRVRWQESHSAG